MVEISNGAIAAGDPLPWMRVRLHPQGEVNIEQFGGLRTALLFLGTASDPRVRAILERLSAGFDALRRESPKNDYAIVPVFADPASIEQPEAKRWLERAPAILDAELALHRAFGLVSGNAVRLAAFVTDAQLIVRAAVDFSAPEIFAAAALDALKATTGQNTPIAAPV